MRHPHYHGRKAESVPSVGSRLSGVVKPSYGKPKLKHDGPLVRPTYDRTLGPTELGARNPRRISGALAATYKELAQLARHAKKLHTRNLKAASKRPRLVSAA
jgi:hypothetical protein